MLFDARRLGVDEQGLRVAARTASRGSAHASRSYRYPFALLAWHDGPVGVDIERIEPAPARFADLICTAEERARLEASGNSSDRFLASLWSGKEALAKALGDAVLYEPARLGSPLLWPDGRAGAWRARELAAPAGHVAWLCWR